MGKRDAAVAAINLECQEWQKEVEDLKQQLKYADNKTSEGMA
jgi:hypothetical protein